MAHPAVEIKACTVCGEQKSPSEFYVVRQKGRPEPYLSGRCRPCFRAANRRWRIANEATVRASAKASRERRRLERRVEHLRRNFGITTEEYDQMLRDQGGVCAICRCEETRTNKGTLRALVVDHDHATGDIRGLLCASCNTMLGMARDEERRLRAAINYLAEARITEVIA